RIDRFGIENNLPTAKRFEGGLDRGRDYEISDAIYRDNQRAVTEIIRGLEQEIRTLEIELQKVKDALA
ncbi:hypothetical protein K2X92_01590, partial [Candidatus Gracilibacteria bacterium]|nr:hypothetical protein [Candidatus Gracilibacteria bacterium]